MTNDGNDLGPGHLYLVQLSTNGDLNDEGKVAFDELYENVTKPEGYTQPWFRGIEHLTRDHEGYVYWKGQRVEHYSGSVVHSDEGKAEAEELTARCQHLERIGVTVNSMNAIWKWEEFENIAV